MKKVGIVMGSETDMPVVKKAIDQLDELKVPFEVHVYSAHRTPDKAAEFARGAREAGFGVIIAAAGMAAHLAGVIASHTTLPVIGLPCQSAELGGMDALLSTVMMPSGVPVATVGIGGGKNAALIAAQIIGVEDKELAVRLDENRAEIAEGVLTSDARISAQYNK